MKLHLNFDIACLGIDTNILYENSVYHNKLDRGIVEITGQTITLEEWDMVELLEEIMDHSVGAMVVEHIPGSVGTDFTFTLSKLQINNTQ
jgi:hypothetical protein